jgi:hypothetical protein
MNQIRKQFEAKVNELAEQAQRFPWEDKDCYGLWLAQTGFLVGHTTRFICLGAANVEILNRDRHYSYIQHLKEESNHDIPIRNDLIALYDGKPVPSELVETSLLMQNQYYWLDRGCPAALLGYSLSIEGLAAVIGGQVLIRVEKSLGDKVTSFLKLHATVDQHHYADGLAMLNQFSKEECQHIEKNLNQTIFLYTAMLKRITQVVSKNQGEFTKAA